jgi:plasmid stability protein
MMPGILIRNVPESLHEKLKRRALANRRSIGWEAVSILEQALEDRAGPLTLAAIDQLRVRGKKMLTQEVLDTAIREGRP